METKIDQVIDVLTSELSSSELKYLVKKLRSGLNDKESLITRTLLMNIRDKKGIERPILPFPVEGGHIALFRDISDYANIDKSTLHQAIISGNLNEALSLIKAGVDVDEDMLLRASQQGYLEIVKALLEVGVDVNSQDNKGWTPLMIASGFGYTDIVSLLIKAGADVNYQNKDNNLSALMLASENNNTDDMLLLIEAGADLNLQDIYGRTALMFATINGHYNTTSVLIEAGADVNIQDERGRNALKLTDYSSNKKKFKIIDALLEAGAQQQQ